MSQVCPAFNILSKITFLIFRQRVLLQYQL
jgi:hypothetical protein